MNKYTLSVGLNDKNTKKQRLSTIEAYKIVENTIVKIAGGGSIFEGRGIYKHDNGMVVIENTLSVELYDCDEAVAIEIIEALKISLNQECIILTSAVVNSKFI